MTNDMHQTPRPVLHKHMSEFWPGDLGLTLISISLVILIFVITPLREARLRGRLFFEPFVVGLMVFGALSVKQSYLDKRMLIGNEGVRYGRETLVLYRMRPTVKLLRLSGYCGVRPIQRFEGSRP
jgi:hypothetical protein